MKKKLVLASKNAGKIKEFRDIFIDFEIIPYSDLGITEEPNETGVNFYENAYIKAKTISDLTGLPVIADDSGICVNALEGAPGIYSARYSGGDDKDNRVKLINELEGKPDRTAYFACTLCFVAPDGTVIATEGRTYGEILFEDTGTNGFGYDCIFYSTEIDECFGIATKEEKNAVSHRGRACEKMKRLLSAYIDN